MTCNQLILLLDIRRGFKPKRHTHIYPHKKHNPHFLDEIKFLKSLGLVEDGLLFKYALTDKGERFCNLILEHGKMLMEGD
jgi:hypothetical protein